MSHAESESATATIQRGLPGRLYELGSERLTLSELARRAGISSSLMRWRLKKRSPADAMGAATLSRGPHILDGVAMTVTELAAKAGVDMRVMAARLRRMPPDKAVAMPVKRHRPKVKPDDVRGRWKVLRAVEPDARGNRCFEVQCTCPKAMIAIVRGSDLARGDTESCGCLRDESAKKTGLHRVNDISEQTFADGGVKVIRLSEKTENIAAARGRRVNRRLWECLCNWCGNTFYARATHLHRGAVTSCGCGGGRAARRAQKRQGVAGDPEASSRSKTSHKERRGRPSGLAPRPCRTNAARPLPEQLDLLLQPRPTPRAVRVEARSYRDITPEMEADLISRSQAGDRVARQTLVVAHDAFLQSIAQKWGWHGLGAEADDILQEVRISFLRSLETADPAKGSLITYAGKLAMYKARRAVEQDANTVRVKVYVQHTARKAMKCGATTVEQIREATGCTRNAAEDVELFIRTRGRSMSLDAPAHDDHGATWLDLQADGGESPEEHAAESERREKLAAGLKDAMVGLTRREIDVLLRRANGETLEQVGQTYDVSRERIRQIEAKAKKRLKVRAAGLREFISA